MFDCCTILSVFDRAHLPARGGQSKRADELDTGDKSHAYATIASELWDPVDTVTQDRYEDILFFREDNLLFTAEHELAYCIRAQEDGLWCRKTLRSGWDALHGEMDDLTCACVTKLGLPVFTLPLETAAVQKA